jgi:hypothetical protein
MHIPIAYVQEVTMDLRILPTDVQNHIFVLVILPYLATIRTKLSAYSDALVRAMDCGREISHGRTYTNSLGTQKTIDKYMQRRLRMKTWGDSYSWHKIQSILREFEEAERYVLLHADEMRSPECESVLAKLFSRLESLSRSLKKGKHTISSHCGTDVCMWMMCKSIDNRRNDLQKSLARC